MTELDQDTEQSPEPTPIQWEDIREFAREIDRDDYDEDVIQFLDELLSAQPNYPLLQQAATLLLQDEIDLSPDLAASGIEPDEHLIELFIAAGADVNAQNAYGEAPLTLATKHGYESIVTMLLHAGAVKEAT